MSLRDNAIVAYAETKVMEKSDRDVFVLGGEILEELLDKTGVEKNEIDGLVHGRPNRHRRRQSVLGADHGRRAGSRSRFLRAGSHRRLFGGGMRRASGGGDRLRDVRRRVSAVRRHPRAGGQDRPQPLLSARVDRALRPDGAARRLRAAQPAPTRRNTASTIGCWARSR